MKKIELDTFMDFRMLSSLTFSPDGENLAYVITGIDREKKEYVSRLRLRAGDSDRPMISDGKIGEFFFEDKEHILFATDRRDEEKKDSDVWFPKGEENHSSPDGSTAARCLPNPREK